MKAFIRSNDLARNAGGDIDVIGFYDDSTTIAADAYGPGVTLLTDLPPHVLLTKRNGGEFEGGMPKLSANWRQQANPSIVMHSEARRRANDVFPPDRQLAGLFEILSFIVQHGADATKWPPAAHDRYLWLEQRFKYVQALNQRADSFSEIPANPASDQIWPTRITG
jgi:hypothetical protein